ncbi:T9SS type A sorting domain-containing protein [Flavobacterium silvaticum]|uniref:T9SS type A sorting domain-containing protein n=1 Tax=Flavobacterium silvaticum TaxID=1852020 RepID=A0A972FKT7_9FLAO|nr:T9SS type A sorting domain-containing protein [Flavobacterium silvaticum]NMH27070.1 T9SS type A sorting domain-containing protein [Flavobacterium silvaticum]
MKKLLLLAAFLAGPIAFAQTTHVINWFMGITNAQASMTIDNGDTVKWMWTSNIPHTVTTSDGAAETFASPVISGTGSSYEHVFTITGATPYYCEIHPMMTGTITVQALAVPSVEANELKFYPNPVRDVLTISAPSSIDKISMFNLSGQKLWESTTTTPEAKIHMENYPSGIYFVEAESQGKIQRFKVVKE